MKDYEGKYYKFLSFLFMSSVVLLTIPMILVLFFNINSTLFIVLNTLALVLASIRVILSFATSATGAALKTDKTNFKKRTDREAYILLVLVLVLQLLNIMFVQVN